jgi:hypothetical protein
MNKFYRIKKLSVYNDDERYIKPLQINERTGNIRGMEYTDNNLNLPPG